MKSRNTRLTKSKDLLWQTRDHLKCFIISLYATISVSWSKTFEHFIYIMGENSGSYIIAMMPLDTCSIFCLIQNTILDYVQAIDGDSDNPRQIIYQFTNSKFCQLIHQQESLFLAVSLWTKFYFLNSPFFLFLFLQCMLYIGYLIINVFQNQSRHMLDQIWMPCKKSWQNVLLKYVLNKKTPQCSCIHNYVRYINTFIEFILFLHTNN